MKNYLFNKLLFIPFLALFLTACVNTPTLITPQDGSYQAKSPQDYYDLILKSIYIHNLDMADKNYLSLRNEDLESSLLPTAMLSLAQAHIGANEYLLANFYFEEFLKSYGSGEWIEYVQFLQLKSVFLRIDNIKKDQKSVEDTLKYARNFYDAYPSSRYTPLVKTMIITLEMAEYKIYTQTAKLYKHLGKKNAYKIYIDKIKQLSYRPYR